MPLASEEYFTAEMVRSLPDDGKRHELVWGELLVSPAPRALHQRLVLRLLRRLEDFCGVEGAGAVWVSPADISWSEDTLVQPDLFVVPRSEAETLDWRAMQTLLLVAEVLSASTAKQDRFQKRKLYQSRGVGLLWLVDPEKRAVEVWTPNATFPTMETECVVWNPEGTHAPLVIALAELFT